MEENTKENTRMTTQPKSIHKAQQTFQCAICKEEFGRAFDLVQHLWVHTVERPFKCDQCGYSYDSLESLQNHKYLKHSYKAPFTCDQCGTRYKSERFLLEHQCNMHSVEKQEPGIPNSHEKQFKCDQCDNSYKFRKDLLKHQRAKHEVKSEEEVTIMVKDEPQLLLSNSDERQLQHDQPGNSITTDLRFRKRRRTHKGKGLDIACKQCGDRFPSITRLEIHLRRHKGKEIQKCKYCGDEFLWKSQLILHERSHTGERPFSCDECGAKFAELKHLNGHNLVCHSKRSPAIFFMCAQCGCKYSTRKELTLHQIENFHIGQCSPPKKDEKATLKDYESGGKTAEVSSDLKGIRKQDKRKTCNYCGKQFRNTSALKQHEMMHTGKKPFICDYCDYSSSFLSNLRVHQARYHPGERPSCTKRECDTSKVSKAPARQSSTKTKSPKLETEKRFKCDICGARFKSNSHLKEHGYIHTGKPYNCDRCGRDFTRAIQFERHQETPCRPLQYTCRLCGQIFSRRKEYCDHRQEHRSNDMALNKPDEDITHSPDKVKYSCSHCDGKFLDPSSLAIHKCTDQSLKKTLTCANCGTMVQVVGTVLSNVFTVTDLSNVKCFINNHTLL